MKDKKLIAALLSGSERYGLLREVCRELGAELRPVALGELGLTVDEVCRAEAERPAEAGAVGRELLLFSGFAGEELGAAVAALRQAGLYIPLKAVRTPANGGWTLESLLRELAAEHEYMKQRKREQNDNSEQI